MEVPLTIADHLRRASLVYGDRVGIIDEPDQPAPGLGELTYRRFEELATGLAAGLDDLGLPLGARVGIVSLIGSVRRRRILTQRFLNGKRPVQGVVIDEA